MRRPKCGCRSENLASSRRPLFHSTFEINFIDPEQTYPVIAVTSRLMSTGFDAQTCKLIVLDRRIASMTEFKQSKKRNIFTKYGDQARAVLEALLQKYADSGITSVESMDILKVDPLTAFGTPMEIVKLFGDKESYLAAIRELEQALYHEAA